MYAWFKDLQIASQDMTSIPDILPPGTEFRRILSQVRILTTILQHAVVMIAAKMLYLFTKNYEFIRLSSFKTTLFFCFVFLHLQVLHTQSWLATGQKNWERRKCLVINFTKILSHLQSWNSCFCITVTIISTCWFSFFLHPDVCVAFQCSERGGELQLEVREDGRINIAGKSVTVLQGTITL